MAYNMTLSLGDWLSGDFPANDLPENSTETGLLNPWIEFTDTLIIVSTETVKILGKVKILGNTKIM